MARPTSLIDSGPMLTRFLRRFSPELRKQRMLVTGSFVAIFAEVAMRLLEPWPLALVIDHVLALGKDNESTRFAALASYEPTTLLWIAAVALVSVTALRGVFAYASAVGFALAGNRLS